ncbi:MAG: cobalt transporter CbiM [Thermoleophilia bacterium]
MHIPDGYLSPQTAGGMWAFMVPAWYWAGHKVKRTLSGRQAPLVAIGAAFTFVIMMFNIPLPGGTTGHAVGGTIVALVIGPWAAIIAISVALVIQALFFGDGGILAIGANCFNMAFVLPVTGYFVYRVISRGAATGSPRRWLGAGVGAYVGLNAAALLAAVQFGLQGELFSAADGSALYSPYGLATSIPAMMGPHLLVIGVIEAVMTSLIYIFLMRTNAVMLDNYRNMKAAAVGGYRLKPLLIGLGLLLVCTPLGLLATGTAWGEWGTKDVGREIGYVPQGMATFSDRWRGFLPNYAFPAAGAAPAAVADGASPPGDAGVVSANTAAAADNSPEGAVSLTGLRQGTPGYLISGVLGLCLAGGLALMGIRLLAGRSHDREQLG